MNGHKEGGPWFVTTVDGEMPPRRLPHAELPELAIAEQTVYQVFKQCVETHGDRNALACKRVPKGTPTQNVDWTYYTWKDYFAKSLAFGKALIALGIPRHTVVNILAFNSPEWFIAFMGAAAVNCVSAGIYTTNGPTSCHYVTKHSDAQVVLVDNPEQLAKYKNVTEAELPQLRALVLWGLEGIPEGFRVEKHPNVKVYTWDDFLALGDKLDDKRVTDIAESLRPGMCCSLIYTSGTTGSPKAAMLSHDNLVWTAKSSELKFPDRRPTDSMVSYLPLSHVAAQMVDIMLPLSCGGCMYFAQPDALKGSLIHTIREVRPNFFFAVPRVWEKFYEAMLNVRKSTPTAVRLITDELKARCKQHVLSQQFGEELVTPRGLGLANKLFTKVKEQLGLDRSRYNATGAAPMPVDVIEYFASIGLPIFEVFGQSESTGLSTSNCPGAWKIGTVGQPYPGTENRFDPDTSELQYRGRNIFMGYLKMEKESAETILPGGWLCSGDVVTSDSDHDPRTPKPAGFFRITGRIKELIITAGGENIPPVLIENELKAAMPAISNAMVIGDRRKFLTVLLTLYCDDDGKLQGESLIHSTKLGSSATTVEGVRECAQWQKYLDDGLRETNKKATSRAQYMQKWSLLPRDFSEPNGDLTPTLKLKRAVVAKKYAHVIDAMYEGHE